MTEAYRESAMQCPGCKTALRELPRNLACDTCGGVFFGRTEIESVLFDSGAMELEISSESPAKLACPHCRCEMQQCQMTCAVVNGRATGTKLLELSEPFFHCKSHGFWLGKDVLRHTLAELGRASNRWLRFGDHRFDGD